MQMVRGSYGESRRHTIPVSRLGQARCGTGTHLCLCEYLVFRGFPRTYVSRIDDEQRVGSSIFALHACDRRP